MNEPHKIEADHEAMRWILERRIQTLERELEAVKVQLATANRVANALLDERDAKKKSETEERISKLRAMGINTEPTMSLKEFMQRSGIDEDSLLQVEEESTGKCHYGLNGTAIVDGQGIVTKVDIKSIDLIPQEFIHDTTRPLTPDDAQLFQTQYSNVKAGDGLSLADDKFEVVEGTKPTERLLNFRGTKISIEEARKSFELDFNENGYCHSCSWHSLWSEYSIEDWEIIEAVEKNDGCLELPCLSKDKDEDDRHRGVFCYVSR